MITMAEATKRFPSVARSLTGLLSNSKNEERRLERLFPIMVGRPHPRSYPVLLHRPGLIPARMVTYAFSPLHSQPVKRAEDVLPSLAIHLAEGAGFGPAMGYQPMPAFKTGALSLSAILPICKTKSWLTRFQGQMTANHWGNPTTSCRAILACPLPRRMQEKTTPDGIQTGHPGRPRSCDLSIRNRALFPAELRGEIHSFSSTHISWVIQSRKTGQIVSVRMTNCETRNPTVIGKITYHSPIYGLNSQRSPNIINATIASRTKKAMNARCPNPGFLIFSLISWSPGRILRSQ